MRDGTVVLLVIGLLLIVAAFFVAIANGAI